ncbi:hypothetical protein [Hymenobacter sp. DG01]|uniref:hypothetical protein n=1 Tax=Hymenobacter sp. DG01 TaxID=2584940 RepID=UPI00112149D8|nr:hypothetical protein [Hymenobacter sp. DG01]
MSQAIKIGFCVAYDWYFLEHSLPLVYEQADHICLSLDQDRISWAGKPFSFDDEAFFALVKRLDTQNKIDIYQDDFHRPELAPMDNEVRQRHLIAERLGKGGWHVQLDADEYFLNFAGFAKWLRRFNPSRPVNIRCPYITLFKQLDSGFLAVDRQQQLWADVSNPVATNDPAYYHGRVSHWFNIYAPYFILHQSWARDEQEIREKISNWGHAHDFDTQAYLDFWLKLSPKNYKEAKNVHPLDKEAWPLLQFVPGQRIADLVPFYTANPPQTPGKLRLLWENSLWASRLRRVLRLA